MKRCLAVFVAAASQSMLSGIPAHAQDDPNGAVKDEPSMKGLAGGCDSFAWDVSHELDVLGQPAKSLTAGTDGKKPVRLELDQHYSVRLVPQSTVHFAAEPGKPASDPAARGGVLSFHTPKAGRYRISLSTSHWLDLIDGGLIVVSSDFQGQSSCEKVHKIVQFELSGNRDFVLQLSGAPDARVELAITQVKAG